MSLHLPRHYGTKLLEPTWRPSRFYLTPGHPLWNGCKLALLGQHAGGTKAYDSSPFKNHGTLTNMDPATDWVNSGQLGRKALEFVAGSTQYVRMRTYPVVASAYTLSCWINAPTAGQPCYGLDLTDDNDNNSFITCGLNPGNWFAFYFNNNSSSVIGAGSPSANTWYHVAGVTRANDDHELFVNGTSIGTSSTSIAPSGSINLVTAGSLLDSTPIYGTGKVSDSAFWNRALTQSELQQLASPDPMYDGALWVPSSRLTFWTGGGAPPATSEFPFYRYYGGGLTV